MPMERIRGYTKVLLSDYLRNFKHSELAKKLFLCCYWRNEYENGYISISEFFNETKRRARNSTDNALRECWGLDRPSKCSFFGFDIQTIRYGTLNDVEAMITNWIANEIKI